MVVGEQVLPKPALITAFDLISGAAGLDLNALFQKRGDVVKRQTRFVSMCVTPPSHTSQDERIPIGGLPRSVFRAESRPSHARKNASQVVTDQGNSLLPSGPPRTRFSRASRPRPRRSGSESQQ